MKYIKEDLEIMLRDYLKNESKLREVQLKKEEYEERLKYAGTVYMEDKDEIIEGIQLASQDYNRIKSNTNKISDMTAFVAMNYKKEENYINKEDKTYLKSKILECEEEEKRLNKIIIRIKNLLEQLTKEEEFVIRTYYMKKCKWEFVEEEYFEKFERHKSVKQLQTYRDSAIKSMLDIINIGI